MAISYVKSLWQLGVSGFLPIHSKLSTVSLQLLFLIYSIFQKGHLLGKPLSYITKSWVYIKPKKEYSYWENFSAEKNVFIIIFSLDSSLLSFQVLFHF